MTTTRSRVTLALLFLLQQAYSIPILQEWGPTENLRLGDGGDPGDFYGSAVDVAGDTLAAGAVGDADRGTDAGGVYVYTKNERRKWSLQQKLVPNDGLLEDYVNDGFGTAISLLPDLMAVGAPLRGVTVGDNPGAVYIFERVDGVWNQIQIIVGTEAIHKDVFGSAVKFVDEGTLVVGAPVQAGLNRVGAIYVFNVDGDGAFQQTSRIEGSEAANNDYFGFSLDSDGTRVIVGAPGDDDNGADSGSAYIFDVTDTGDLVETTRMIAEFGLTKDEFGYSVAIGPTTAVVGARSDDDNFIGNSAGTVFIYNLDEDTTSWELFQRITRTNPFSRITGRPATGLFGSAIALDGDYLAIGAPNWDNFAFPNVGRIFIYEKRSRSGKWRTADAVGACGEVPSEDNFGVALALDMSTKTMVVGVIEGGGNGQEESPGTVIIFERRPFSKNILIQKIRCWIPSN